MACINFDHDPEPNVANFANLVITLTELKDNLIKLNSYALNKRNTYWTNSRLSSLSTTVNLIAKPGANQYVGLVSGLSPGALTDVLLPLTSDMTPMDSFFFQDESINANTYNITIKAPTGALIYGPGLASGGVSSVTISDAGGYKELLYATTNKWFLIRKSA